MTDKFGDVLEKLDFVLFLCLGLAIIAVPFWDSIASWKILGGIGKQLSFFPLFLLILLGFARALLARKFIFPYNLKSFICIVLFMLVACLSAIVNHDSIAVNVFKSSSGIEHFVKQILVLIFHMCISLVAFNMFINRNILKQKLLLMRRFWYLSCILPICYCLVEMGNMLHIDACTAIKAFWDMIFRGETGYWARLRSVAAEASYLAPYMAMVFPWIFSGIASCNKIEKRLCVIFTALLVTIGYFSFSRTVHLVLLAVLFCCCVMFKDKVCMAWKDYALCMVLSAISVGSFYSCLCVYSPDIISYVNGMGYETSVTTLARQDNFSNIARYASWLAGWEIFKHNFVCGVGFGQYGFYASDFYPSWAWSSHEIRQWSNDEMLAWPPVLNLYIRILAECGLLGFLCWLMCLVFLVREVCGIRKRVLNGIVAKDDVMCMIAGIIGILINGFSYDSLRLAPFWIYVGVLWALVASRRVIDKG